MTPLSYTPVTSVPCSVCGASSIRMTSWPDGRYWATCEQHADQPVQIGLWMEST